MERIAIFGGTFDPIHIGHLRGIIETTEIIEFDSVFLVPAGKPPHKTDRTCSSPGDRLAMVTLAAKDIGFGKVSSYEIDSAHPSFTLNTLTHFRDRHGDPDITLIIGSDSLLQIHTWHSYEEILSRAHLAVLPRPGFLANDNLEALGAALKPVKIKEVRRNISTSSSDYILTDRNKKILLPRINRLNISSTDIRQKVKDGKSIKFLVTDSVEQYIIEKRLYREV